MPFTPKNDRSCTKSFRSTPFHYRNGGGGGGGMSASGRRLSPPRDSRHFFDNDDFGTAVHDMSESFTYPDMRRNTKTYSRNTTSNFSGNRITPHIDKYTNGSGQNRNNGRLNLQRNSYSGRNSSPKRCNRSLLNCDMGLKKSFSDHKSGYSSYRDWRGRKDQNYDSQLSNHSQEKSSSSSYRSWNRQWNPWKFNQKNHNHDSKSRNGHLNKSAGSFYGQTVKHRLDFHPLKDRGSMDNSLDGKVSEKYICS